MGDPVIIHVVAVIFLATLIRSTFGFGEALIAVPLLALRIPVKIAVPLAVLVSVIVAAVIVAQDWRKIEVRSAAWLIISALLGVPIGVFVLVKANDHLVKAILGAIIVGFSAYSLFAKNKLHLQKDHQALLLSAGLLSGILGGAYGMNGPPLVVYGALRRWSPQHFRAMLQGYFLPVSLASVIVYMAKGLWLPAITRYFLLSMPGVIVAIFLGRFLNHRLRGHQFFQVVYLALIVIGAVLLLQGVLRRQ